MEEFLYSEKKSSQFPGELVFSFLPFCTPLLINTIVSIILSAVCNGQASVFCSTEDKYLMTKADATRKSYTQIKLYDRS